MTPSPPVIVRTVAGLRDQISAWRGKADTIGLVPTMGSLHDGHLALVGASLAGCRRTVVTIFVNPAQFGPTEDFETYPREEAADLAKLSALGAHLVFAPDAPEMYADGFATRVNVAGVGEGLCGAVRPHFFQGVATIVSKLLLQSLPDRAYFGEKDYQQLLVVKRLARDLDIPVEIVGVPTVREADGLALSSRNAYLTADQRTVAPRLHQTMRDVANGIREGRTPGAALEQGLAALRDAGFDPIDYLEVRDRETLTPLSQGPAVVQRGRVFAAAYLGDTRLIDNIAIDPT
ncbi:MAG: pantoate--beta-alanine ligase [Alphaproteobacteria bacterium]|nr:pantoate--beta-alanine ligase [Alphaproteobacteria bacterium]